MNRVAAEQSRAPFGATHADVAQETAIASSVPRRYLALWLPFLSTDRLGRDDRPVAVVETAGNRVALAAVNEAAVEAGLVPGMTLAGARAFVPSLTTVEADGQADAAALEALGRWAERFTPLPALDPCGDGLILDIGGCAHLWGGEAGLMAVAQEGLEALGFRVEAALAATPGAAVILSRHAGPACLVPQEAPLEEALAPLPVAALTLIAEPPAASVLETLSQVGLRRIGDLFRLPRPALTTRFGGRLVGALEEILGRAAEDAVQGQLEGLDGIGGAAGAGTGVGTGVVRPINPLPYRKPWRVRLGFPDPIGLSSDIEAALDRLLTRLCHRLEAEGMGCRRLVLTARRADGSAQSLAIGTARPARDPAHLKRLFEEKLKTLEVGLGIDAFLLEAMAVEICEAQQADIVGAGTATGNTPSEGLTALVDRLTNRLGDGAVLRLAPVDSHRPDMAQHSAAPVATVSRPDSEPDSGPNSGATAVATPWPATPPRPIRRYDRPKPLQLLSAPRAGEPPLSFRLNGRRCHVRIATGPERISPDWWRRDARWTGGARDYFKVELEDGRRLWIYRDGALSTPGAGAWFLEGVFA